MPPGTLELAHQHDEHVVVDDLVRATAVTALALVELGVFG